MTENTDRLLVTTNKEFGNNKNYHVIGDIFPVPYQSYSVQYSYGPQPMYTMQLYKGNDGHIYSSISNLQLEVSREVVEKRKLNLFNHGPVGGEIIDNSYGGS